MYLLPGLEFQTYIHCKQRLHRQFWTFWIYFVDVKTFIWTLILSNPGRRSWVRPTCGLYALFHGRLVLVGEDYLVEVVLTMHVIKERLENFGIINISIYQ